MRAMPLVLAPVIVVTAFALAGCTTRPAADSVDGPDTAPDIASDGVDCSKSKGQANVYIDIDYESGAPKHDTCEVDPGTTITWRGLQGSVVKFRIKFKEGSPAGRGEALKLDSEIVADERGGRPKARIKADNVPGKYEYDVMIGRRIVDPAIIIRRLE